MSGSRWEIYRMFCVWLLCLFFLCVTYCIYTCVKKVPLTQRCPAQSKCCCAYIRSSSTPSRWADTRFQFHPQCWLMFADVFTLHPHKRVLQCCEMNNLFFHVRLRIVVSRADRRTRTHKHTSVHAYMYVCFQSIQIYKDSEPMSLHNWDIWLVTAGCLLADTDLTTRDMNGSGARDVSDTTTQLMRATLPRKRFRSGAAALTSKLKFCQLRRQPKRYRYFEHPWA